MRVRGSLPIRVHRREERGRGSDLPGLLLEAVGGGFPPTPGRVRGHDPDPGSRSARARRATWLRLSRAANRSVTRRRPSSCPLPACTELFRADREIAERTPGLRAEHRPTDAEEDEREQRLTAARREYRERQEEARPLVQRRLREVFTTSRDQPWEHRLADTPRFALAPAALEATTPETYLAVEADDLFRR